MADWYLYLIRCRDNTLYTGITTNVEKRFESHQNNKGAKYLRGRGPIDLVFSRQVGDRGLAARLEYRVKQLNRQQKEALVSGVLPLQQLLQGIEEE